MAVGVGLLPGGDRRAVDPVVVVPTGRLKGFPVTTSTRTKLVMAVVVSSWLCRRRRTAECDVDMGENVNTMSVSASSGPTMVLNSSSGG